MEVHHHSQHGKKKWTEYFWEFLMLFVAVSLGFYTEMILKIQTPYLIIIIITLQLLSFIIVLRSFSRALAARLIEFIKKNITLNIFFGSTLLLLFYREKIFHNLKE